MWLLMAEMSEKSGGTLSFYAYVFAMYLFLEVLKNGNVDKC
jgi:hypothetical protein